MKTPKHPQSKQYYSVKESFTSRTDIDPILKLVLINIFNKLRIPTKLLKRGFYTFSASNVAQEMGLGITVTFYRFKILEHIGALKYFRHEETTNGSVALYTANVDIVNKIIKGEIMITNDLLKLVRSKKPNENKEIPFAASSLGEIAPSLGEVGASLGEVGASLGESSIQSKQTEISTQKVVTKQGTGIESFLEELALTESLDEFFGGSPKISN